MPGVIALVAVAVLAVLALAGIVTLAALGLPVPDGLWGVLTTCVGALAGAALPLLRRTAAQPDPWDGYPNRPPDDPAASSAVDELRRAA